MTVDNIQPKIKKTSEAKIKANARYTKKTYKNRTICIKLKDIDAIDDFLNSRNQSATQYFYSCLKRDGVIE
jgi:hypothetical protein